MAQCCLFQPRLFCRNPTSPHLAGFTHRLEAVLTTAHAVLKDDATREQVHIIQEYLHKLSVDFARFQQRMDKLATHIQQAHDEVLTRNSEAILHISMMHILIRRIT